MPPFLAAAALAAGGGSRSEGNFFCRETRRPRTKHFSTGGGFYPVYLTDETVYLPTTVYGPSRPQAVLLVEIIFVMCWNVKTQASTTLI
jgi:hypothetical protein